MTFTLQRKPLTTAQDSSLPESKRNCFKYNIIVLEVFTDESTTRDRM